MQAKHAFLSVPQLKLSMISAMTIIAAASLHAQADLLLDFTITGGSCTSGWNPVCGKFLADSAPASISGSEGFGYNFPIKHVGCYDNWTALEPLTESGFYRFGDNAINYTVAMSGLATGATVSPYACAAWDGIGRRGVVVFGDSGVNGVKAHTIGATGTSSTLASFHLIGTATFDDAGFLQGKLNVAGGRSDAPDGQLGGAVFAITSVPKPGTLALIVLGLATLAVSCRKNLPAEQLCPKRSQRR